MTKTFCPLPFSHIAIRPNGKVYPCCNFDWNEVPEDLDLAHPDVFNHPFIQDIRSKMIMGENVKGCNKCYTSESLTNKSVRKFFIENADFYGLPENPTEHSELKYVDLALSNTCNNRCRMCGPELSTNWYADAKALGVKIPKGILNQKNVLDNYDLSKLRFIKMIGGEPLMEQEKFIDVLERCDRPNLSILLTTNVTLLPNDRLTNLLKECKHVKINLSIDAINDLNDFLRKGSKWSSVVENIKWFYENFSLIRIHAVVSIYNVNCLDKLYLFTKNNFPNIDIDYVICDGPDWMMPRHLPESVKSVLKLVVYKWITEYHLESLKLLQRELNQLGDFRKFIKHDTALNDLRKENWMTANPELYEMVKEYYE